MFLTKCHFKKYGLLHLEVNRAAIATQDTQTVMN